MKTGTRAYAGSSTALVPGDQGLGREPNLLCVALPLPRLCATPGPLLPLLSGPNFSRRTILPRRNCRAFGLGLSIGFVNRTKPASYAVHDDADAFHANKYGERNVQKVGPVVQGFGNVG